jgi:hypothetical protein
LPPTLRWAVRLLAVEAAGVGLLAAFLLYRDLSGGATDLRGALGVTAYATLTAAALAGLAVALSRRKARGRAPAIVLQLLAIALASFMIQGGLAWLGVPVTLLGLLVAVLLLVPATTAALSQPRR